MIAEKRSGTRRYYSHDAQGHTVALYDGSQTKTDTFTYWPYGEIRTPSGSTPTKYKYLGAWSCRTQIDGSVKTREVRELETKDGRFRTVDPLWPAQRIYAYGESSPLSNVDGSGYFWIRFHGCTPAEFDRLVDIFNNTLEGAIDALAECIEESGCNASTPPCLKKHRDSTRTTPTSFDFYCQHNCSGCGHAGPPNKIYVCFPSKKDCNLPWVIAHELIHMCGIPGFQNYAEAFRCVGSSIPGCAGFRGGHGLDNG